MMSGREKYTIRFAGLTLRFLFPEAVQVPYGLETFVCEDEGTVDAEYKVELLKEPLSLPGSPIGSYRGMEIYGTEKGWLRVYRPLVEKDDCQVASLITRDGKNTLYYPASKWSFYAEELRFLHLIGIEEILLRHDALLLHSSVVHKDGHMVLFSGPSGVGKSTQASLWEKHLGAEVINGDRCIVRKTDGRFWGAGSPWCGTSGIYRNEMAPLKGIFILRQADKNAVRRLNAEAFIKIYQQCIVNEWDGKFVVRLTDLTIQMLEQIPVYELNCRPDQAAARLAYNTLFEGDI